MKLSHKKHLIQYSLSVAAVALLLIVIGFLFLDLQVANFFNLPEQQSIYYYSREITNIGYSIHYFLLAIIGIIFSKLIYSRFDKLKKLITPDHNLQIYRWSVFSIKVLLITGLVLNLFKTLIGRQRPHASSEFHNLNFDFFSFHSHWHSFPSGHSQVLFTVATLAWLIFPKYKYFYFLAALIFSMTRITIHQHFFSDMIAGAAIGHLSTLWFYYYWKYRNKNTLE